VAELNAYLAHPLTLHAFDPIRNETFAWVAPPERWGEWITISATEADPAALQWQVDPQQARNFVETAAGAVGPERTLDISLATAALLDSIPAGTYQAESRLYHQDREHVVQSGETLSSIAFDYGLPYPWIEAANPQLNGTLSAGQTIVIPSPDVMLPLPVVAGKRIVVNLSTQEMWAYAGDEVIWHWPVSTGIESSPTAPGVFQIQAHEENAYAGNWDLWMPHFMGIYRPVPTIPFMNGFHGFPTRNGSTLLWTGDLGRPVTYGCILLSSENAALLYDWAEPGVVVEITP
jgi:LysM repeat protein